MRLVNGQIDPRTGLVYVRKMDFTRDTTELLVRRLCDPNWLAKPKNRTLIKPIKMVIEKRIKVTKSVTQAEVNRFFRFFKAKFNTYKVTPTFESSKNESVSKNQKNSDKSDIINININIKNLNIVFKK